ncbi:MAG: class I SAM-dependent methyltransferase [Clostridiales Family XIII bacterium]|jgi:SAM-dependent methyltransferase|nr:class I SAM-dependent methyltransferase [Clostridiales Family XIII bacterium]
MGAISPGGPDLIAEAVGLCAFPAGARVLDAGCGEGDALAFLKERFGLDGVGIDAFGELLDRGRERHPGLDLRLGEMTGLDFPSYAFDGVIMECSLSLCGMQEEALHEAYCVLKKGGKLIIADLYVREPDMREAERARREARDFRMRPHAEGDCGRNEGAPPEYCLGGAFVADYLIEACLDTGFENPAWSDRTALLNSFVAEKLFEYGSLAEYWRSILPSGAGLDRLCRASGGAGGKLGYFLMTLDKPR